MFPFRFASAFAISILLVLPLSAQEPIVGRAVVVDGDTIEIAGQRIRLWGIDAPESGQTCRDAEGRDYRCGQQAAFALDGFLAASVPTRCAYLYLDQFDRIVATCVRADGADVGSWLVRQGWALDYVQFSGGAYAADQAAAEAARAGMWVGEFTAPWDWRRPEQTVAPGDCLIKGNINWEGERIYHLPGWRSYDATIIDMTRGERWFCTEEEAIAAGWRAPRG